MVKWAFIRIVSSGVQNQMCEYCHEEYCCIHGRHGHYYHHYPRHYVPERPVIYYREPTEEERREYLEEEKRDLERRLKEIETSLHGQQQQVSK
ncbi:MAG TPA: hypothetical protein VFF30_19335 [Nitrososphaerales archaeon]|nr:hypothetical protein [Nitrososphaerales archaeon]